MTKYVCNKNSKLFCELFINHVFSFILVEYCKKSAFTIFCVLLKGIILPEDE